VLTRISLDHSARLLHAAAQHIHQERGFAMSLLMLLTDSDSDHVRILLTADPGPKDLADLAELAARWGAVAAIKTREGRVEAVNGEPQTPTTTHNTSQPPAGHGPDHPTAITTTAWWPGKDLLDLQITWIRRTLTGDLLVPDKDPHRLARHLPDPALLRAILPAPAAN
jgi:hypothetical protein